LIAWAALPRGDSGGEEDPQPLLDFLANRDVLILIVGYAAAIWGCVGLRQWIVVFLVFCAGDQAAVPAQAWIILVVGAVISFLGVPAGLIGNELSPDLNTLFRQATEITPLLAKFGRPWHYASGGRGALRRVWAAGLPAGVRSA
jgi:hypothetical protein